MDPNSFREIQVQTRGEFGGLGIEVTMEDGLLKVVAPIDETLESLSLCPNFTSVRFCTVPPVASRIVVYHRQRP
jgi:hypothetical protein